MLNALVPIESRPGYMWSTINSLLGTKVYILPKEVREPVKNYLAEFFRKGGLPPDSAKGFRAE